MRKGEDLEETGQGSWEGRNCRGCLLIGVLFFRHGRPAFVCATGGLVIVVWLTEGLVGMWDRLGRTCRRIRNRGKRCGLRMDGVIEHCDRREKSLIWALDLDRTFPQRFECCDLDLSSKYTYSCKL